MEALMERLKFVCPKCGGDIDVGIESEIGTLLRIRQQKVRAQCPACGHRHEWSVGEGQLTKAA
jgi:predicted RNA-binding Zn-ribbon protein involved in translation (DUF1610 family)